MRIDPANLTSFLATSPVSAVSPVSSRPGIDPSVGGNSNSNQEAENESSGTPDNLTPDSLWTALTDAGVTPDAESVQIAESLVRLGLPITDTAIADARVVLARFPGVPVAAYALARVLNAPMSAGVLRALTQIVNGSLENRPVPLPILDQLAVSLPGSANPDQVVRELYQMVSRLGRSTEQTLSIVNQAPDTSSRALFHTDPRAQLLLTLAVNPNMDRGVADAIQAHAANIEGQQILNQSALSQTNPSGQLYFAFPINMGDRVSTLTELLVHRRDEEKYGASDDPDSVTLQAVLRMNPARLGKMEVRLTGTHNARLSVGVAAERQSTVRFVQRGSKELITGLTRIGWNVKSFTAEQQNEFEPLWSGGAELQHPRHRIDQKA